MDISRMDKPILGKMYKLNYNEPYKVIVKILKYGFNHGCSWGIPAHEEIKVQVLRSNKESVRVGWKLWLPIQNKYSNIFKELK